MPSLNHLQSVDPEIYELMIQERSARTKGSN